MDYQVIAALRIQNRINMSIIRRLNKREIDSDVKPIQDLIELLDMQITEMDKRLDSIMGARKKGRLRPKKRAPTNE